MLLPNYTYRGVVLNIVDGDTADVEIDVGFNLKIKHRVRFLRINTPEIRSKELDERKNALAAKEYTASKILNKSIILITHKSDAFGRYLAEIFYEENGLQICLNDELLESGMAKFFKFFK